MPFIDDHYTINRTKAIFDIPTIFKMFWSDPYEQQQQQQHQQQAEWPNNDRGKPLNDSDENWLA